MSPRGPLAVVTGANAGIGRAMSQALAARGWTVVMVGRSEVRLEAARSAIVGATGHDRIHVELADLSVQREIRELAGGLLEGYPPIDALMNNAAIFSHQRRETADGIELQFAVNHLAPFLLTNLLLDRLREGRVITTSSRAHRRANLEWDNLQGENGYSGLRAYSNTKLANILFNRELARRTHGGPAANVFHPGLTGTELLFGGLGLLRLLKPFIRSPERGARTGVYLATDPAGAEISGGYWKDERAVEPAPQASDDEAAKRLWEVSAWLTRLA